MSPPSVASWPPGSCWLRHRDTENVRHTHQSHGNKTLTTTLCPPSPSQILFTFPVAPVSSQDRPGIVTGWWQQGTIDKMRMLTLEALSTLVKHKKQEMAAAAAAAAAATAGDAGASAGDGGKSAAAGAATTGASSSCLAAAVVPGQATKVSIKM